MAEVARYFDPGALPLLKVVKYSSWSTPMPHLPAVGRGLDAAGAGLAAGTEHDVGALTEELLRVGGALVRVGEGLVVGRAGR